MAVNFPQNPQEGDTFASGKYIFVFTDGKWVSAAVNPNYADIQGATGATGPQGADGGGGDPGVRYQQGTWDLTWTGNGASISIGTPRWTRIGDQVTCYVDLQFPVTTNTAPQIIGNLPYPHNGNQLFGKSIRVDSTQVPGGFTLQQTSDFDLMSVGSNSQQYISLTREQCSGVFTGFLISYITNDTTFNPSGTNATVTEDIEGTGGGSGTTINYNGASAWGSFAADGTIEGGLNIASVTVAEEGVYDVVFTTPMANADYSITGSAGNTSTGLAPITFQYLLQTPQGFRTTLKYKDVTGTPAYFSNPFAFTVHSANAIAPPSGVGADAWGDVSVDGTLSAGYNVTVTPISTGTYNVNFNTNLPSANYSVTGSTTEGYVGSIFSSTNHTVNGFTATIYDAGGNSNINGSFNFTVHASSTVTPTYTWTREGTTLKPANDGDDVEAKNISTAWVNFAGSSQVIRSEYNVTSITRISEGSYRVNFTVPMDNADYAAVATSTNFITAIDSQNTTSLDVSTFDNTFARADSSIICIVIYGGKS